MRPSVTKAMFLFAAILASAEQALAQAQTTQPNIIHVEVIGLRSGKGQVICALYSSRDGFPKQNEKAVARVTSAIAEKQAVCEFSGTAPGTYAISVFHDENSNGKLDTKFMGIPSEGVGHQTAQKAVSAPPNSRRLLFLFRAAGWN